MRTTCQGHAFFAKAASITALSAHITALSAPEATAAAPPAEEGARVETAADQEEGAASALAEDIVQLKEGSGRGQEGKKQCRHVGGGGGVEGMRMGRREEEFRTARIGTGQGMIFHVRATR